MFISNYSNVVVFPKERKKKPQNILKIFLWLEGDKNDFQESQNPKKYFK